MLATFVLNCSFPAPFVLTFKSNVPCSPHLLIQQNEKFSTDGHATLKRSTPLRFPGRPRSSAVVSPQAMASNTFFNFGRATFLRSLILAKFEMPEGFHRRHGATAKLTCGLLVTCLSAWASFSNGSGVWRKQICGAGADIGEVRIAIVGRTSGLLR